jgi:alanine racemase
VSFPCAVIDGRALTNNLGVARRAAPNARVLAVIKANAYGHGMVAVARGLAGADALGVARVEEGLTLRAAGLAPRQIVLLEGVFNAADLAAAAQQDFELVVHSFEQIELLEAWQGSYRFRVWVKIDTGMNRLGFRLDAFNAAWQRLRQANSVAGLRVMTHLATADERANPMAANQITGFQQAVGGLGVERCVANSPGILAWPDSHCEWIRPGLMLYGLSPFPDTCGSDHGLQPVMTLRTQLIAVREVRAGESVGYGATWRAPQDACVAIVAAGYGDGYPRHMTAGAPVLVNGREGALAGRVSMDMIAVDVSALPRPKMGDPVVLWGEGLPVERVAPYATAIPYELVCGVSQRVPREWA